MKAPGPTRHPAQPRRVLVVNEEPAELEAVAAGVTRLGYEALFADLPVMSLAEHSDEGPPPDVALVGRSGSDALALDLINGFVHDRSCPAVARLESRDAAYVAQAALRGAFASVVGTDARDLQAAIDIAVERFHQYRMLQDAFARRAVVEQAKGILMARHGIDQDAAFDLLRRHARRGSRKVADVAAAIIQSHELLAPPGGVVPSPRGIPTG